MEVFIPDLQQFIKTSFLNYLTPDNSYNSIFVSANLLIPIGNYCP